MITPRGFPRNRIVSGTTQIPQVPSGSYVRSNIDIRIHVAF